MAPARGSAVPAPVVRLLLAYDGTGFRGFARQPRHRTVQGVLEDALRRILGEVPDLSVAGRTDAGVHARGQVVSFPSGHGPGRGATERLPDLDRLRRALNGMLAPEVVVRSSAFAPPGFDARRSATAREYRYRVDEREVPDPFDARFVWHHPGDASLRRMRSAAGHLAGEHDFASFCRAPGDGRSTVRRIERLAISRREGRLAFSVRGNAFCHQMVRSLVGTLVDVGEGRIEPGAMPSVLRARDRSAAGRIAPAHGLTLERVIYGAVTVGRAGVH